MTVPDRGLKGAGNSPSAASGRCSRAPIPKPRAHSTAGFTLIELIVVIVIISMAMVLVAPRLPAMEGVELRRSSRALASTLRHLGESAVTGKTFYRLHIDLTANALRITRKLSSGDEVDPEDRFLARKILGSGIVIADIQTPRLGKVSEGEVVIDFAASGLSEFLTLHLRSPSGKTFTIMAFPGNGKVKLLEGYQEFSL